MSENTQARRQILRISYPNLYEKLINELATHHIHPFDIQATSKNIDDQLVELEVRFGDNYGHHQRKQFAKDKINEKSDEFTNFCKEVGETCKEALIADYFKMVKP